jgi:hypothetical protein
LDIRGDVTIRVRNNSQSLIYYKAQYNSGSGWTTLNTGSLGVGVTWTPPFSLTATSQIQVFWSNATTTPQTYPNIMYMETGDQTYVVSSTNPQSTPWFEPLPKVSVAASWPGDGHTCAEQADWYPDNQWPQGCTSVAFVRTGSTATALTVYISFEGEADGYFNAATPGVDFVNEDNSGEKHWGTVYSSVTIPAGDAWVTVPIIPLYDEEIEGTEQFRAFVDPDSSYEISVESDWFYIEDYVP